MLPYLILLVRFFEVLAVTSSYNQDSNTTLSLDLQDGNSVCSMKPVDEVSYLKPWREISQRAQGCSVPYFGPQGHGQNPEEVCSIYDFLLLPLFPLLIFLFICMFRFILFTSQKLAD